MNMKLTKKLVTSGMILLSLSSSVIPVANVFASENTKSEHVSMSIESNTFDNATPTRDELKEIGLTDEEIDSYLNSEKSGITLYNGEAYDKDGNLITDGQNKLTRGKLSWAVKAIRKAYNSVPDPVKKLISKYAGLETFLGVLDHFTGAVENAIYSACIQVGMPDWAAWTVSKALTLLI